MTVLDFPRQSHADLKRDAIAREQDRQIREGIERHKARKEREAAEQRAASRKRDVLGLFTGACFVLAALLVAYAFAVAWWQGIGR